MRRKKEKALLMQGGGIKTANCYLKRSKMVILPKARTQLNQKKAIARRFAILTSFFIGYASSVKIKSERKIISSSPTKGFINSTVRIRSPGRTSGTPE